MPVADLQPGEVIVTVEGTRRSLMSLEFVNLAQSSGVPTTPPGATTAEPTGTSRGRKVLLLFAHESIRPGNERPAIQGAVRLLKQLHPADQVALITIPRGRIEVNLTTDREAVQSALNRVVGRSQEPVPRAGRDELLALIDVLDGIRRIDGRKVVVLVCEGLCPPNRRTGPCAREDLTFASFEDVGTATARARADFFLLQPHNMPVDAFRRRGPTTSDDEYVKIAEATDGLEDLSGVTGGELYRLSGASDSVFDRIVRETSGYYLASFAVDEGDRTGKDRKIVVRVTRSGVTIRARPVFRAENTSR
jgi:VWFA-related protein